MNTPIPIPPASDPPGLKPGTPAIVATIGGFAATTIVIIFHMFGKDFPAGYEAALASFITAVATYAHSSGRQ